MPHSPAKICNFCHVMYRGLCKCRQKHKDKHRPSAAKRGYDRQWRKRRLSVISRDPICRMCRDQLTQEVDHIKRKAEGGTDDMNNLQGLCRACHQDKTISENREN
jgi:5-methylcytosine-specific restriction protein A